MNPPSRGPDSEGLNTVAPSPQKPGASRSVTKGDIPPAILDRYLIERDRQSRPERFYRDHRAVDPMFKDEGRRLVTQQAYPDTVADMIKIAQHRGWSQIRVAGDEAFRREAWIQAKTLGLEIRGYSPRDRDRQASGDKSPPKAKLDVTASVEKTEQRLRQAAVVVRRLVADPAAQVRLMERAYAKAREILPETSRRRDEERPRR